MVRLGRLPPLLRGGGVYGLMFDYAYKHQFAKALPPGFSVVISHPHASQAQPRLKASLLLLRRLLLSTKQYQQHRQEAIPSFVVRWTPSCLAFFCPLFWEFGFVVTVTHVIGSHRLGCKCSYKLNIMLSILDRILILQQRVLVCH